MSEFQFKVIMAGADKKIFYSINPKKIID